LIQPGLHDVIIGSVASPPVSAAFTRDRNSVPSSMIVRSAVKLVSKMSSKPSVSSAIASWPVTREPGSRPNSSPMATRMAGATCATQRLVLSLIAFQTISMWLVALSAPTGHTTVHWPQNTQLTVPIGKSIAGPITVLKPRFCAFKTPVPCTWLQTVTQRRHSTHLLILRVMDTEVSSPRSLCSPSKRVFSTPSVLPSS